MIIHLTGNSGSGKDSAYKIAKTYLGYLGIETVNVKFSRGIKGCLEYLYNLPPESLDTDEYKSKKVPGMDLTFLEVLILAWGDSENTIFGQLWIAKASQQIAEALESNKVVFLSDVRRYPEITYLHSQGFLGADYHQIRLEGRGQQLESDNPALADYMLTLSGSKKWVADNSRSIIDLRWKIEDIMDIVLSQCNLL